MEETNKNEQIESLEERKENRAAAHDQLLGVAIQAMKRLGDKVDPGKFKSKKKRRAAAKKSRASRKTNR